MKKEKMQNILDADYRTRMGKSIIQNILHKIKPLAKYNEEVPFEAIEKVIDVLSRKYNVGIRNISIAPIPNDVTVYKAILADFNANETLPYVVYGCTMYELYAKIAVVLYDATRKQVGE